MNARCIVAIFSLLVFTANQSTALACAKVCEQSAQVFRSEISNAGLVINESVKSPSKANSGVSKRGDSHCHGQSEAKQATRSSANQSSEQSTNPSSNSSKSTHGCAMVFCDQSLIKVELLSVHNIDNESGQRFFITAEPILAEFSQPLNVAYLVVSSSPVLTKVRLHLRLRRLLI